MLGWGFGLFWDGREERKRERKKKGGGGNEWMDMEGVLVAFGGGSTGDGCWGGYDDGSGGGGRVPVCGWENAVILAEEEVGAAGIDFGIDRFEKLEVDFLLQGDDLTGIALEMEINTALL